MIKCISFDLWGTLITSNPEYSAQRAKIVSQHVDQSKYTTFDVQGAFKLVKRDFDSLVETYGVQFKSKDLYDCVFNQLGITESLVVRRDIIQQLNVAFCDYPPIVIEETLGALETLHRTYKLILISNTLLIDGSTLYNSLRSRSLWNCFEQLNFSDELRCSKPSPKIFRRAFDNMVVNANEVVHVGDNPRTDGRGIMNVGGNFFYIHNDSDKTIVDVVAQYGN